MPLTKPSTDELEETTPTDGPPPKDEAEEATRRLRTQIPGIRDTLHSLEGFTGDTIKSALASNHPRKGDVDYVLVRLRRVIKEALALAQQADRVCSGED